MYVDIIFLKKYIISKDDSNTITQVGALHMSSFKNLFPPHTGYFSNSNSYYSAILLLLAIWKA